MKISRGIPVGILEATCKTTLGEMSVGFLEDQPGRIRGGIFKRIAIGIPNAIPIEFPKENQGGFPEANHVFFA